MNMPDPKTLAQMLSTLKEARATARRQRSGEANRPAYATLARAIDDVVRNLPLLMMGESGGMTPPPSASIDMTKVQTPTGDTRISADKITSGTLNMRGEPFLTIGLTEAQAIKRERIAYEAGARAAWSYGFSVVPNVFYVESPRFGKGVVKAVAAQEYPAPTTPRLFKWKDPNGGKAYTFRMSRIGYLEHTTAPTLPDAWTRTDRDQLPQDAALYRGWADLIDSPFITEPIDD